MRVNKKTKAVHQKAAEVLKNVRVTRVLKKRQRQQLIVFKTTNTDLNSFYSAEDSSSRKNDRASY